MAIRVKRYARHPLFVNAIQVTARNMAEVAEWCGGMIESDRNAKAYIKVDVIKPTNPRQGQAYVGEYILKTDTGIKVYGVKAFEKTFLEASETPEEKLLTEIFSDSAAA